MHWRWHITMAASILTRVTGIGSYIGLLLVGGWALALASGRDAYETYMGLLGSIPGQVVLFGFTVSTFYHLAAGLRHLMWDLGKGYAPKTADASAWAAILFAVVASVAVWAAFLMGGQG
jgi:succinate dehydrogenase / fumarate reductase cytochrome b subunit